MFSTRFWTILALGEFIVALQGIAAVLDGFLTRAQMLWVHNTVKGYSFMEHGGMWADAFIVTPLLAYLMSNYNFAYSSTGSVAFLVAAFALWALLAAKMYAPLGAAMPEAHAHDGYVTVAGWIHVLYAAVATWIIALAYLPGMAEPQVSSADIIIVSAALSFWTYLGVAKFSGYWTFDTFAKIQVGGEIALIWCLAAWRLW